MQQRGQTPCRRQQQHGECAVRRGGSLLQGRRERVVAHAIDAPSASPAEATASVVSAAASTSGIPPMVFEPQVDPVAAAAQLSVLAASVGLAAYWWNVVVPSERASLAKAKRRGGVGEYLAEVNEDPERKLEQWFYTDWLRSSWFQARFGKRARAARSAADAAETSRVASRSSVGKPAEGGADTQLQGQPADDPLSGPANQDLLKPSYETPTPSFFSLDNPIVATAVLLIVFGLSSSVLGQVSAALQQ